MNSPARRRLMERLPENVARAQRMNKVEDRILNAKISSFQREEKHLRREIEGLRKCRHTLHEKIEPCFVPRPRSSTEPRTARQSRVDSGQLPQIPHTKAQSCSPRERSTSTLSIPDNNLSLFSRSCEAIYNECELVEDRCTRNKLGSLTPTPRRKRSSIKHSLTRMRSLDLNSSEDEWQPQENGTRKVGIGGKPVYRRRAFSELTPLTGLNSPNVVPEIIICEEARAGPRRTLSVDGSNGHGGLTPPVLSPILTRRGSAPSAALNTSLQKTNVELMEDKRIISKFSVVGHLSLGAALLRHRASVSLADEFAEHRGYSSGADECADANTTRRKSIRKSKTDVSSDNSEKSRRSTVTEWKSCKEQIRNGDNDIEVTNQEDYNNNNNNNNNNNGEVKDN